MTTAAAVVVGIGLFASPFSVQADEETDKAPEVLALYVANSGSIGFEADFDVTVPWEEIHYFDEFHLIQDGYDDKVDDGSPRSDTLRSDYCGWLDIPGYDVALYSMTAWASDSDDDGYEVSVYYSAGGSDGPFVSLL